MKRMNYKRKVTKANTVYTDLALQDQQYLKKELGDVQIMLDAVVSASAKDKDYEDMAATFTENRSDLPRRGEYPFKHNSIKDFVDGLIHNFDSGNQRNYSEKQLRGLEVVFGVLHDIFPEHIEDIEFVEGQPAITPKPKPTPQPNITQNSLFDFGDYEVSITVRKKV